MTIHPVIELAARHAHEVWIAVQRENGVTTCPARDTGEELMVAWADLSATARALDYATATAVAPIVLRWAADELTRAASPSGDDAIAALLSAVDLAITDAKYRKGTAGDMDWATATVVTPIVLRWAADELTRAASAMPAERGTRDWLNLPSGSVEHAARTDIGERP